MSNERGIALVITLLVVTLLVITVVEFSYSVLVDQQLVRNSLSAMQASMLARSGINLGQAVLARDSDDPQADWYFEDWANPDIAAVVNLDSDQRLRVQVVDEGGKINVNRTRPRAGTPPPRSGQPNLSQDAFVRDALRRLFEANEIDVQIPDRLLDYWGVQDQPRKPGGAQQPVAVVEDFRSLEDFAGTFGIGGNKLTKLSKFLTALPALTTGGGAAAAIPQSCINVNTAPVEVLAAVINDSARVDQIVQQREGEEPLTPADVNGILQGVEHQAQVGQLFCTRSWYFRIYSSAMVSADPTGQRSGGVGQTVVALVNRRRKPGVAANAPPDMPRWTLTPLDWQKRGGAELLVRPQGENNGQDDTLTQR
ncbi:MAG: general secretion pathway protein GspK [Deltaproteobacteria bacterium]|nr:general secretion pathway protein GspK [Deltaproteobacteria bacterium]